MNKILIDTITGTILNYDNKVFIVDVDMLDDTGVELLAEWEAGGNDNDAIALAHHAGVPVTDTTPYSDHYPTLPLTNTPE